MAKDSPNNIYTTIKFDGSDLPEVVAQNVHTSIIDTTVRIRKATYEGKSRWTIMYKRAVEVAIFVKNNSHIYPPKILAIMS